MSEVRAAYLGLGGNLGDRAATLARAADAIGRLPGTRLLARSSLYETPPWGETEQGAFLNAALAVETDLSPERLLAEGLAIERSLGRVRERRWGPRAIDIDILHVEGVGRTEPGLVLPHPYLTERAFVLVPLAEIAPALEIEGRSVASWLAGLDRTGITRIEGGW